MISIAVGVLLDAAVLYTLYSSKEMRLTRLEHAAQMDAGQFDPDKMEQSLVLAREVWQLKSDVYGPTDRATLRARAIYVSHLSSPGHHEEWRKEAFELIALEKQLYGPKDEHVLQGLEDLAANLDYRKQHSEAEGVWREVLQASTEHGMLRYRGMVILECLEENLDQQEKYDEELAVMLQEHMPRIAPLAKGQRTEHGNEGLFKEVDYRRQEVRLQQQVKHVEAKASAKRDYETARSKLGAEHDDTKRLKTRLEELQKTKL
ncbi:MAG: hypothetical protein ACKVY0_28385 [Prosthecobacter sp.]|uniref:hypothetical protein n=1 Tax=Prosthecobacter sp. TaxID=1965333 RepID=UPI0038FE6CA7